MRATASTSFRSGRAAGFTLIELAVVVFVIALLIGSILVPLSTQVEQRQVSDTQKMLDDTREALIGFAVINGRLPRPAVSFSNGTERAACGSEADCTGFIPWTVLGTPKLDAWGKIIRYSVTPVYANAPFTLTTAGTKTVQTRNLPNPPFALVNQATGLPAVVFSHGRSNWGTSGAGVAFPDAPAPNTALNVDEDVNVTGTTTFISRVASTNTAAVGGEFDDLFSWVALPVLANRMVAAGKLP